MVGTGALALLVLGVSITAIRTSLAEGPSNLRVLGTSYNDVSSDGIAYNWCKLNNTRLSTLTIAWNPPSIVPNGIQYQVSCPQADTVTHNPTSDRTAQVIITGFYKNYTCRVYVLGKTPTSGTSLTVKASLPIVTSLLLVNITDRSLTFQWDAELETLYRFEFTSLTVSGVPTVKLPSPYSDCYERGTVRYAVMDIPQNIPVNGGVRVNRIWSSYHASTGAWVQHDYIQSPIDIVTYPTNLRIEKTMFPVIEPDDTTHWCKFDLKRRSVITLAWDSPSLISEGRQYTVECPDANKIQHPDRTIREADVPIVGFYKDYLCSVSYTIGDLEFKSPSIPISAVRPNISAVIMTSASETGLQFQWTADVESNYRIEIASLTQNPTWIATLPYPYTHCLRRGNVDITIPALTLPTYIPLTGGIRVINIWATYQPVHPDDPNPDVWERFDYLSNALDFPTFASAPTSTRVKEVTAVPGYACPLDDYLRSTARITWGAPAKNGGSPIQEYRVVCATAVIGSIHITVQASASMTVFGTNVTVGGTNQHQCTISCYNGYWDGLIATVSIQAVRPTIRGMDLVSLTDMQMVLRWTSVVQSSYLVQVENHSRAVVLSHEVPCGNMNTTLPVNIASIQAGATVTLYSRRTASGTNYTDWRAMVTITPFTSPQNILRQSNTSFDTRHNCPVTNSISNSADLVWTSSSTARSTGTYIVYCPSIGTTEIISKTITAISWNGFQSPTCYITRRDGDSYNYIGSHSFSADFPNVSGFQEMSLTLEKLVLKWKYEFPSRHMITVRGRKNNNNKESYFTNCNIKFGKEMTHTITPLPWFISEGVTIEMDLETSDNGQIGYRRILDQAVLYTYPTAPNNGNYTAATELVTSAVCCKTTNVSAMLVNITLSWEEPTLSGGVLVPNYQYMVDCPMSEHGENPINTSATTANIYLPNNDTNQACAVSAFNGYHYGLPLTINLFVERQDRPIDDSQTKDDSIVPVAVGVSVSLVVMVGISFLVVDLLRRRRRPTYGNKETEDYVNMDRLTGSGTDPSKRGSEKDPQQRGSEKDPQQRGNGTDPPHSVPPTQNKTPPKPLPVVPLKPIPASNVKKPSPMSDKLNLAQLGEVVLLESQKKQPFGEAYGALPNTAVTKETASAAFTQGKNKNRFKLLYPFDFNRVVLKESPELSNLGREPANLSTEADQSIYANFSPPEVSEQLDYINASFIEQGHEAKKFIAAQAPNKVTISDFWSMIVQQDISVVVMLTGLVEEGKIKCEQYYPESEAGMLKFGGVKVHCSYLSQATWFTVRHLDVSPEDSQNFPSFRLRHYHFTAWPDHGIPSPPALLSFFGLIEEPIDTASTPVLVHCSAGVGRTGTLIALHSLCKEAATDGTVDVTGCVAGLRRQRTTMIQTKDQYAFLHSALLEWMTVPRIHRKRQRLISDLEQALSGSAKEIREQHEAIRKFSRLLKDMDCTEALAPGNADNNRSRFIVPENDTRVLLFDEQDKDDYINAVFVDSFLKKDAYILTEEPMCNTKFDFWRLILEKKLRYVISIDIESDSLWAAEGDTDVRLKNMSLQSHLIDRSASQTLMDVTIEYNGSSHRVTILQLHTWKANSEKVPPHEHILDIYDYVKSNRELSDTIAPVLIQCSDGASQSGLLVVLFNILDQLSLLDRFEAVYTAAAVINTRPAILASQTGYVLLYQLVLTWLRSQEEDSEAIYANQ